MATPLPPAHRSSHRYAPLPPAFAVCAAVAGGGRDAELIENLSARAARRG
ncbi:hypothetical protein STRAU_3893 [Streptomyces aurantiacus JA 4570]|uniref:Uncharacterized protein n=1 Tax=Streptomyces aurantiacus JA 4570 TaxID=1286094 RepID=S3ZXA7_9ACTN|nr:hypothetical protein STRAU_3893 [Streptomyces aurantiacus JA 4570]